MACESLPIVDFSTAKTECREPTVWGTLLAAGTSSRYGDCNKLLATLDDDPLIHHAAHTLRESVINNLTIVVGYEADRIRTAVTELDIEIRVNEAYEQGQSTSVQAAVMAAREHDADAIVIALGDMPYISTVTINRLVMAYTAGAGDALAAACEGRRGNPVLFDSRFFDALTVVEADTGGREVLLNADDAALVETGDPGVRRDVNTPADFENATET